MTRENLHLLISRAVDGAATPAEREELARALKVDPLLRAEFEEHEAASVATASLFRQIALPEDFSKRVMRRIQGVNVPADTDADDDSVRLPAVRPLRARPAREVTVSRRRARLYAIVAFVSAAAALILALGVITGAFSSNVQDTPEKTAAEGGRGVPDKGELNRTGSPTPQPSPDIKREPKPDTPDSGGGLESPAPEKPAPQPDKPQPRVPDEVSKPEPKQPEQLEPKTPESEPQPDDDDVVETPAPEPDKAAPEPTQPKPDDRKTETRVELGRMLVLNGRVDLVGTDGSLSRLTNEQPIYPGDRLRTRYNAVIMLQLAGGDVTLGKDTQVLLDCDNAVRLEECDGKEKGLISVDRTSEHSGSAFAVVCGDYSLYLNSGAAMMERKRKALHVSKAVGFATLTHDTLGSILFPTDSGYQAEVEFGKDLPTPRAAVVQLPSWCGETRSQTVMLAIADALAERKFSNGRERTYVNTNLPGKLDDLMTYATTTDSVVELLKNAIAREQLDGAAIVKLAGEVVVAFSEVSELAPEVITQHASRAAMVAESYDQWHMYFYRLLRPPVEPKNPRQPPGSTPDCPNAKSEQPPRKVKPAPPNNTDIPEESGEKSDEKSDEAKKLAKEPVKDPAEQAPEKSDEKSKS